MNAVNLVRPALVALFLLGYSTISFSQAPPAAASATQQIIYTGKLLGYFRVPSLQPRTHVQPCQESEGVDSKEATEFLRLRRQEHLDAVLVGTGDNFAPRLEARTFAEAGTSAGVTSNSANNWYRPRNKELYVWDGSRWLLPDEIPDDQAGKDLNKRVEEGKSTIPSDNVACFLRAAKFAAIVPGKHDFYFGPERVRELGRLLASNKAKPDFPDNYEPVQMLGANLVIKTTRVDGAKPPSKVKPEWAAKFSMLNLDVVYPWFSYFNVEVKSSAVQDFLDRQPFFVCTDTEIFSPADKCRLQLKTAKARTTTNDTKLYELTFDTEKEPSMLATDESYGLCVKNKDTGRITAASCVGFSVLKPFFYYPNARPKETDPEPYVFLDKNNVAIFGIVDPKIGEHIGVLNFSWLNVDKNSQINSEARTEVSAEDPVPALRQQLDYFDRWYSHAHDGKSFSGLKILLAQMNPENARLLAAKFPEFQMVVSAADQEQATSGIEQSIVWTRQRHGTFVAVPPPAFDTENGNVIVQLGEVDALNSGDNWTLRSEPAECPIERVSHHATDPPLILKKLVDQAMSDCLRPRSTGGTDFEQQLKRLTLCAMREQLGADVALIQKRDFYFEFTADDLIDDQKNPLKERVQQMLDRIVWKGDLLTLLYVPGSVLKKALDQSDKFKQDDSNFVSLADERWRQLEILGVDKPEKEYLINEMPLDEKKIYVVATTDYIGAGDTGYPALKSDVLSPRTRPTQFPNEFETISSVVCHRIFSNEANASHYCLGILKRDESLDRLVATVPKPSKQSSLVARLWNKGPFKWPNEAKNKAASAEQKAQQHPIWMWSLKNLSFSFTSLSKNLSDTQINQKFAGTPTSGVTARRTSTVTAQVDTRISHSSHPNEFFVGMGLDYKEQSTGDVSPQIVQLNNRATGDIGFIRNISGGRSQNRAGIAYYMHAETPLEQPIITLTLGTKDTLKLRQNRNYQLLFRTGLRMQNRLNSFEAGFETGPDINAFKGYRFNPGPIDCLPTTQTFVACVTNQSTTSLPLITKNSTAVALLETRKRAGMYWKFNLSIPFNAKVRYELKEDADFFFNFSHDNSIDPRYRDTSKHSLKFTIWPSFSIGPSLQLLLYKNKVNGDFLFQKQLGIETSISFDLFNRREKVVQIKHKP